MRDSLCVRQGTGSRLTATVTRFHMMINTGKALIHYYFVIPAEAGSKSGIADDVRPGGIVYIHRAADRRELALGVGLAFVDFSPDDIVDLFLGIPLGIEPTLYDLNPIQVAPIRSFSVTTRKVSTLPFGASLKSPSTGTPLM